MATNKKPVGDDQLRARAEGRTYTGEELIERAGQLEAKVAQLKNRYEQFFLGMERKPPSQERDGLHKELEQLRQVTTPNTALKFRFNSLFNRFLTYERMWQRTEKDIEEGRYRKDLFKARLHAQQRRGALPSEEVDSNFDETDEITTPGFHGARPAGLPPPVARPPPQGPNDDRLKAIYSAYITAKKECRESVQGLTYEQMVGTLRSQVPEILKQTKAKSIDFKVVIKDGKASLRAIPKNE